tara:strand:- start:317 stop:478 length:162 start_codon:yes stop_codon:yes gene_type:complete
MNIIQSQGDFLVKRKPEILSVSKILVKIILLTIYYKKFEPFSIQIRGIELNIR